jgi:hypothetical protein
MSSENSIFTILFFHHGHFVLQPDLDHPNNMLAEGGVLSELPRRGEELPTVKYMCRSHEV